MASNWIGIVIGVCLLFLQQEIKAQFVYSYCGLSSSTPRITQGANATMGSAPFMAYLIKDNKFHCGGSIVNNRYVLTAAHCVERNMKVRLGEYDDRSDQDCNGMVCMPKHEEFGIEIIAFHRDFNLFRKIHDIALIKLNRNITFNENIQPICLHQYPANAGRVNEYRAYGWGLTSYNGSLSHVLQTTKLRSYPNSYCESKLKQLLTVNQICAGSQGSDSCGGDSGGPLVTEVTQDGVTRYLQLGLVSFGDVYCLGTGTYTYVPNYGTWIMETMRKTSMRQRPNSTN